MSEKRIINCNCGCGKHIARNQAEGWLILNQITAQEPSDKLKLDEELHFASIECLELWSARARQTLPELQKTASQIPFRSELRSDHCEGFHI